jgi:hypothetical protein
LQGFFLRIELAVQHGYSVPHPLLRARRRQQKNLTNLIFNCKNAHYDPVYNRTCGVTGGFKQGAALYWAVTPSVQGYGFIELCAARFDIVGRAYRVFCAAEIAQAQWLMS